MNTHNHFSPQESFLENNGFRKTIRDGHTIWLHMTMLFYDEREGFYIKDIEFGDCVSIYPKTENDIKQLIEMRKLRK